MNTYYIGLATSPHDAAISIVYNGEVIFAEATERYLQNKRAWNAIPDDIVRMKYLIKKYCTNPKRFVISNSWSKKSVVIDSILLKIPSFMEKLALPPDGAVLMKTLGSGKNAINRLAGKNTKYRTYKLDDKIKTEYKTFDHHLSHAATACYSSKFEEAVCVIVDGYGETTALSAYKYNNGKFEELPQVKKSFGSLGGFYWDLCEVCGWDPIQGEEWKVMGLAPYGKYNDEIYKLLQSILSFNKGKLNYRLTNKNYKQFMAMKRPENESPLHSADIAFTGQLFFCEKMNEILNYVYNLKISENLVLTGGCALNSAYNGKILKSTPFKKLFIPSAPADDGNAIGAALLAYYEDHPFEKKTKNIQTPFLGEKLSDDTIKRVSTLGNVKKIELNGQTYYEKAASLLADGKIIGWVQGRAEFGPRALGNRSILADARNRNIKEILNDRVKFREEFRPLAPSILHEFGEQYFENYEESPYMERTLKFKQDVMDKVPGVVHVDGTGRLQSVKKEWNEEYYNLIHSFYKQTNIPLILNTSFNIMGKPIIHTVEDAIAVFFTSGLDALVLEDNLYIK